MTYSPKDLIQSGTGCHIHLGFQKWLLASRAWRNGTTALESGYAAKILYVGHKADGLSDHQEIAPNQTILRIGGEPAAPGSSRLLRAMSLPRWNRACENEIPTENISMVIAHSLTALPASIRLARRCGVPLLYDAHELESERNGWKKPIRMMARLVEGWLIRKAHHTTVVNESIRDWYENAYPGLSLSTVRNVPKKPAAIGQSTLRETLGIPDEALVFIYCGVMSRGRTHVELIEAFRGLGQDRHVVLLGGDGGEWDTFAEMSRDIPNVHMHPAVPQSELPTLMSDGDVGLSLLNPQSLSYFYALPNKLFEYAAAGLAICVGPGEEVRRFADAYPLARTTDLSVEGLREMAQNWTREEINAARPAIEAYEPPTWEEEQAHLLDAFDLAIRTAGNTPPARAATTG